MNASATFDELYKAHYVRVFGLCRRLLNSASLAEDASQETFLRAYRKFREYDGTRAFWPWISTIASRHCIDQLRRLSHTTALFGDETAEMEMMAGSDQSAISLMVTSEQATTVSAAIDQLPDKYRVPLVLSYFDDYSYDQIAASLDVTRSHVGVLLLRGRQQLRGQLALLGVEDAGE